jgi:SAM-dependent methyltransferase
MGDAVTSITTSKSGASSSDVNLIHRARVKGSHDWCADADAFAKGVGHEKNTIIAPAIERQFKLAASHGNLDLDKGRSFDFGAGAGHLARVILREGGKIDLIDVSKRMLKIAKDNIKQMRSNLNIDPPRFVTDYTKLKEGGYDFGMMNFVTQEAASKEELSLMFEEAAWLCRCPEQSRPGAKLIVIISHLDWLHTPHSAYEYDIDRVPEPHNGHKYIDINTGLPLKEGDAYTGRLINDNGQVALNLKNDHYWKRKTIIEVAEDAGFDLKNLEDIDDKPSSSRRASVEPAYMMFTFERRCDGFEP